MIPRSTNRRGAVLILVVGMIAILATIATAFLARSRGVSAIGEDAIRLAQTRIMLNAALTYIREASRLGYADVDGDGLLLDAREAWGWIDTRTIVPTPTAPKVPGNHVGPNDSEGGRLWTAGAWPAPGGVMRAPMYCMRRPPLANDQSYVRNPVPADITQPTFGIPFVSNPDPTPLLPEGAYFDRESPTDANRKVWFEGDPTPVPGTADLAWFRIYREEVEQVGSGPLQRPFGYDNEIPEGTGICTFIVTVGAGGTRGFRNWAEVGSEQASFGNDPVFFAELLNHEQRQWFRVGWSAAVGGGEDLIVKPAIEGTGSRGITMSHYEAGFINSTRWRSDDIVGQSQPRNYGGTISFIQRLDGPPPRW